VRDDLNQSAPRVMCVLDPLRVEITNWPEQQVEQLDAPYWPHDVPREGSRTVPFTRELFIERGDFSEDPPKGFFRLAPGTEVRLRYGYIIRCDDVVRDGNGTVTSLRCTYDPDTRGGAAPQDRNVKGTLHWVSAAHGVRCEVRLYDRLFSVPDPDADADADFREHLNPESLVIVRDAVVEPSLAGSAPGARFQFERLGYFVADTVDSRPDALVFNRTVTLRDTWARVAAAGTPRPSDGRPDRTRPGRAAAAAVPGPSRVSEPRDAALEGRRRRLEAEQGGPAEQANVLTRARAIADLFDAAVAAGAEPRSVAKVITNDMPREARERAASLPVDGAAIGALVRLLDRVAISSSAARAVLAEMLAEGGDPDAIVARRGLRQLSDEAALRTTVDAVLDDNPAKVQEYRDGKTGLLGFFVGQAMARTGGKANPALLKKFIQEKLDA
jgi:glutaminyl-tRNA synthetase